jgi:hypothetical protein
VLAAFWGEAVPRGQDEESRHLLVPDTHAQAVLRPSAELPMSTVADVPLEQLGLSVRPHNALVRAGIDSERKLVEAVRADVVMGVRNIGRKSVEEILERLAERGSFESFPESESAGSPLTVREMVEQAANRAKQEELSRFVGWQLSVISRQIRQGKLHPKVVVGGVEIASLGCLKDDLGLERAYRLASVVLESTNVAGELEGVLGVWPSGGDATGHWRFHWSDSGARSTDRA